MIDHIHLRKFSITPEKCWLEDTPLLFKWYPFQGTFLHFQEGRNWHAEPEVEAFFFRGPRVGALCNYIALRITGPEPTTGGKKPVWPGLGCLGVLKISVGYWGVFGYLRRQTLPKSWKLEPLRFGAGCYWSTGMPVILINLSLPMTARLYLFRKDDVPCDRWHIDAQTKKGKLAQIRIKSWYNSGEHKLTTTLGDTSCRLNLMVTSSAFLSSCQVIHIWVAATFLRPRANSCRKRSSNFWEALHLLLDAEKNHMMFSHDVAAR